MNNMPDKDTTPPEHTDLSELREAIWYKAEVTYAPFTETSEAKPLVKLPLDELMDLVRQYAQPPVVADKELDEILAALKLEFSEGESWTQSNGDQSWQMPPPQVIKIGDIAKAKAALLQREQRQTSEAYKKGYADGSLAPRSISAEDIKQVLEAQILLKKLSQLRHNTNAGRGE